MSDRWQEMAVFVRVAETGSLSRAGRELMLSQPSVSRIVGALEARLGTTLLLRTTRSISLTEAGSLYLDRARSLLAEVEEAEQAARGVDSLQGVIRLAMPVLYGSRAVVPTLATFLARHPGLRIEITMSDARQNLVTDGGRHRHPPGRRPAGGLHLWGPQACGGRTSGGRGTGVSLIPRHTR